MSHISLIRYFKSLSIPSGFCFKDQKTKSIFHITVLSFSELLRVLRQCSGVSWSCKSPKSLQCDQKAYTSEAEVGTAGGLRVASMKIEWQYVKEAADYHMADTMGRSGRGGPCLLAKCRFLC